MSPSNKARCPLQYSTDARDAETHISRSQVAHSARWHMMEHSTKYLLYIFKRTELANVRNHRHTAFHDLSLLYLLSLKGKCPDFFVSQMPE